MYEQSEGHLGSGLPWKEWQLSPDVIAVGLYTSSGYTVINQQSNRYAALTPPFDRPGSLVLRGTSGAVIHQSGARACCRKLS